MFFLLFFGPLNFHFFFFFLRPQLIEQKAAAAGRSNAVVNLSELARFLKGRHLRLGISGSLSEFIEGADNPLYCLFIVSLSYILVR